MAAVQRLGDTPGGGRSARLGRFGMLGWMLAALLVYSTATRIGLAVLSWRQLSGDPLLLGQVFAVGWLYDLAFYAYALIPMALYIALLPERWWRSTANRWWVRGCAFAALYVLGFVVVAEFLFWDEFQARFNFIAVDYLVYRREVTDNIQESYPLAAFLVGILVVTALVERWLWPRLARSLRAAPATPWRRRLAALGLLLAAPLLAYVGLDQQLRELSPNAYATELAGDGPYQFFAAFRNNELDYERFYATLPDDRASALLKHEVAEPAVTRLADAPYDIRRFIDNPGAPTGSNILLVMVESLSAEYLGAFGNREGLTPFLDQLADQSLLFTDFFATGNRTVRGLEAVTLSIPPTPGRAIVKRPGQESGLWSLGQVLRTQGYETRFLYGGRGYFDNMSAFFAGNGYEVTDETDFPADRLGFKNAWGVADEYLYDVALDAADRAHAAGRPFFFHLMTTSNHRPYTYPEGRIDIAPGTGREGAVKYTDWALRHLFEQARTRPWFKDTLVVVVADHCAGSAGKVALPLQGYRIPLLIHGADLAPARIDTLASQIDLAPTLLAMLNLDYPSAFFGHDIFTATAEQQRALIGTYQALGLYEPGRLSILRPNRRLERQRDPESGTPRIDYPAAPDGDLERAIAWYQGASRIYATGIDHWPGSRLAGRP